MIVYQWDGETNAVFFNSFNQAESFRRNAVCGMGAEAELYERKHDMYVLVYA
jgi:hypothetical protein